MVWQGRNKESLALLGESLPPSLANSEVAIRQRIIQAIASYYLQRFADANDLLSQAQRLSSQYKPELLGDVAIAQGTLAVMRNDLTTAERSYRLALETARRNNRIFLEANALGSLGFLTMRQQHYSESIDWSNSGLDVARRLRNRALETKLLANLGWCYYQMGDYERALASFTVTEASSAQLGLLKDQMLWTNNLGLIQSQQRDYIGAEAYYKKSLDIARKLENKSAAAIALNNLAASALETKQFDLAERYNSESLKLQREIGDKAAELYPILNEARIEAGRKNYAASTKLLAQVIKNSGEDISLRWEAESELANVYAAQKQTAKADAEFRRALDTIDRARASLSNEEYRLSFLGSAERFYNDYIDFLIAQKRTREALQVAEHSRARTLAEGLKLPPEELRKVAVHPERSAKKLDAVILEYWLKPERSYLWAVTPSRVELYALPGQDEIEGAVQEYRKALLGPRDVKETANASGQKLYEMLVAPAHKLIEAEKSRSRRAAGAPSASGAPAAGRQFVPRVIVIADGALHTLNFETLLVRSPQPHYWIEDAVVSNASSIALLGVNPHLQQRQMWGTEGNSPTQAKRGLEWATHRDKKLLLIGDPNYAGTDFPALSQAKTEVQRVQNYFPELKRVVVEGNAATPSAYAASNAGQFGYIHFVAHGTASRISPLDSSIVLSREGDAYKLYAREIMQKPLRAELVTISACYGAGNRTYSGEGLVGLSWAFLRAGAHNVIAALWEVNDASTPQLMDGLYSGLSKGQNPAQALRAAKLAMLHSDTVYRRPFYWGAFQIYVGS